MVAITHSNDYNARMWSDIMDTDNKFTYISSHDDSSLLIDIIEINGYLFRGMRNR